MRRTAASAGLLVAGLLPHAANAQVVPIRPVVGAPNAVPALNIRVHDGLDPPLIRKIAEIGEPTTAEVATGDSVIPLVEAKCGSSRNAYLDVVRTRNPALVINRQSWRIAAGGTMELPACAWIEQNVSYTAPVDQQLRALLDEATGFAGGKTFARFRFKNPQLGRVDLISAGQTVTLPYRSRVTTITLVPRYASRPTRASDELEALFESAMLSAEAKAGWFIPVAARGAFQDATNSMCPAPRPGRAVDSRIWPFDAAAFLEALKRVDEQAKALNVAVERINVGILDSGFPAVPAAPFIDDRLSRAAGHSTYNRYGVTGNGDPTPPFALPGDPDSDHGTMVATLALGGPRFLELDTTMVSRIRLRLARINDPGNGTLQDGYVINGIDDAIANGAKILNASFEFDVELASLMQKLAARPDIIMVAAAGNDGRKPRDTPRYPANYGGFSGKGVRDRFLIVGSSTIDGDLAPFSAHGFDYIDVLAPGCDIPTYLLDLTEHKDLGTSLSAPIVTFLVATVSQLGLNGSGELRERALIGADPKWSLYQEAFAAGVINPLKMIEIFHDYVELMDGTHLSGRVSWNWDEFPKCQDNAYSPTARDKVMKLGRLEGSSDWVIMWRTRSKDLQRCRPEFDTAQTITIDGRPDPIPLTSVKDIVMASLDPEEIQESHEHE